MTTAEQDYSVSRTSGLPLLMWLSGATQNLKIIDVATDKIRDAFKENGHYRLDFQYLMSITNSLTVKLWLFQMYL